jgi:hypothetical protein
LEKVATELFLFRDDAAVHLSNQRLGPHRASTATSLFGLRRIANERFVLNLIWKRALACDPRVTANR